MEAINKGGVISNPYPIVDTLFFKIQGDEEAVRLTWKTIKKIIQEHGSTKFEFAATDYAADEMWRNRKYALMSALAASPGYRSWPTDVWYSSVLLPHSSPVSQTLQHACLALTTVCL
jgi:D-lactate dehydrogenase (cytochrome)